MKKLFFPQAGSLCGVREVEIQHGSGPPPLRWVTAIPPSTPGTRGGAPGNSADTGSLLPGFSMCTSVDTWGRGQSPCWRAQTEIIGKSYPYNVSPLGVCFFNSKIHGFGCPLMSEPLISHPLQLWEVGTTRKWGQQILRA